MNILFWNIHRNSIADRVAKCALENSADIICLAEHGMVDPDILCQLLGGKYRWVNDKAGCDAAYNTLQRT